MIYSDLPAGATVFVDAGPFIHHFERPQPSVNRAAFCTMTHSLSLRCTIMA